MNKTERIKRIIARGELSDHCHVIVGGNVFISKDGTITIKSSGDAKIKHLKESEWIEGSEIWTGEHKDILLKKGTYTYVPQIEFDPFEKIIQKVVD